MSTESPVRACRPRRKSAPSVGHNKLLGIFVRNGVWWAAVQALRARPDEIVLCNLVPVGELKGGQRKKAARWLKSIHCPDGDRLMLKSDTAATRTD